MSGCTAHGVKLSAACGCVEAFVHKTHSAPWGGVILAEWTKTKLSGWKEKATDAFA